MAIVNNTIINMEVQVSSWYVHFELFGCISWSGIYNYASLMVAILTEIRCNLNIVLIYISLMLLNVFLVMASKFCFVQISEDFILIFNPFKLLNILIICESVVKYL